MAAGLVLTGSVGAEYYAGAGYGVSWNGGHAWTDGRKYDYETFSGIWSLFGGANGSVCSTGASAASDTATGLTFFGILWETKMKTQ